MTKCGENKARVSKLNPKLVKSQSSQSALSRKNQKSSKRQTVKRKSSASQFECARKIARSSVQKIVPESKRSPVKTIMSQNGKTSVRQNSRPPIQYEKVGGHRRYATCKRLKHTLCAIYDYNISRVIARTVLRRM